MHIQHIESTSDHTGNFSGPPPPPQNKVAIGHPIVDLRCGISYRHSYIYINFDIWICWGTL